MRRVCECSSRWVMRCVVIHCKKVLVHRCKHVFMCLCLCTWRRTPANSWAVINGNITACNWHGRPRCLFGYAIRDLWVFCMCKMYGFVVDESKRADIWLCFVRTHTQHVTANELTVYSEAHLYTDHRVIHKPHHMLANKLPGLYEMWICFYFIVGKLMVMFVCVCVCVKSQYDLCDGLTLDW